MHTTLAILILALGTVESTNKDKAIGRSGEISRYQIMPSIWKEHTRSRDWQNPDVARTVATRILTKRIDYFVKKTGRLPNAAEAYALWSRPGMFETRSFNLHKMPPVVIRRCKNYEKEVNRIIAVQMRVERQSKADKKAKK